MEDCLTQGKLKLTDKIPQNTPSTLDGVKDAADAKDSRGMLGMPGPTGGSDFGEGAKFLFL